eukprot:TRINITY_DN12944_c0_g1_i1.p1 TRINITY_DN12944_c0_g1~~TRINITY_DN12944_c0_g1_i1.p1  ORF type:complete len:225 (-),score=65.86 TRINITY_DN12944_c0_g1_i1:66-740(-)
MSGQQQTSQQGGIWSMFSSQPAPRQPTQQEMLKANKKGINKSKRDLDKEIRGLERQEAKVELEIKKYARLGQNSSAKLMAKELVRIRKQKEALMKTKVTLGTVASRTETASANMAVQRAMSGATRAMKTANQINSPEKFQATMQEFERQSTIMDLQEELLDELLEDSSEASEVEELVGAVFDEIGLELNSMMVSTPKNRVQAQPAKKQREEVDDTELETLLGAL